MFQSSLQKYMTDLVNSNNDTQYPSIELDGNTLIHLVPSWTSDTSIYAKKVSRTNIGSLYSMPLELRYPELKKISGKDAHYARTRYEIEAQALNNFISYYKERPIDRSKSFLELYEPFISNTSDDGIVYAGRTCCFEEDNCIYVVPQEDVINMLITDGINPHTHIPLTPTTMEKLRNHYRVEMEMVKHE